MAVKLRLRRMGRKKLSVFSVVAADARSPRDGRFIEDLGRYEPVAEPARVNLNADRILYWLQQGAQPTHTVRNLLSDEGLMLHLHLLRKGKSGEEIEQAVTEFRANRAAKQPETKSAAERRREQLEAERKVAAEQAKQIEEERAAREAELEQQRQEADAAERASREAADAAAAEAEGEAVEADVAEADATVEEASAEEAADEAVAEASADDVAESAPEVAEEQPAVEEETIEAVADETGEEVAEQTEAAAEETPAEEEPVAEAAPAEEEATEAAPAEEEAPAEEPVAEVAEEAAPAEVAAEADDLTKVWGIGPVFAGLLADNGVTTFAALAAMDVEQLRAIVNESGTSASAANEESWARQAELAAAGDWDGLDAYVEELKNA